MVSINLLNHLLRIGTNNTIDESCVGTNCPY